MSDIMEFADRKEFRQWLSDHYLSNAGVWLLFGKAGGPKTIKASEALEEALCFGWIDGQIKSLEEQGLMTDWGRKKIEEAKENGQWDAPKSPTVTEEQIVFLSDLLKVYEPAYANFQAMPLSVKKTYTRAYFDAKTDAGR